MRLRAVAFDESHARHFLTLSSSVVLPMQLTVHEPRPFTAELMRELVRQLTTLVRRFVKYDDVSVVSGGAPANKRARRQRMVSFVDVDAAFRPGSMKEHREGALWFAYSIVRADEHNDVASTHVLQPTLKAAAGTWHAFDVLPWLLTVVVAPSPRTFAMLATPLANPAAAPPTAHAASAASASVAVSKFFQQPAAAAAASGGLGSTDRKRTSGNKRK